MRCNAMDNRKEMYLYFCITELKEEQGKKKKSTFPTFPSDQDALTVINLSNIKCICIPTKSYRSMNLCRIPETILSTIIKN